ncbi:Cof-type HAD-IIB family hydrolase [Sediminibacillus dalangtanensis]|uniref:Cof-type HAD-IIB family hydrolase n=1 Tax=Sediminibacillus dalangtanensis TaxID=2729421 RepID=A0ABX7VSI3_9BACI|nr:HAD family hydrolase [Sediminibacillus dalangtanensis]QTM98964.1 Cof-type HAD-IIB family hydrolase [Sediminibacillus dalangtanensis]
MSDYKVLFLDIDGTILRPDHTIQDSTRQAVLEVKEKGVEVFLATGRPLHEIADIATELDIHSFIGYNGAFAIYRDEVIVDEPLKADTVRKFTETASRHGHEMVLYTSEKNYYTSMEADVVKQFIDVFELKKNAIFGPEVIDEILGVTLMKLSKTDTTLYKVEDDIDFSQVNVSGLDHCYDVIRDSVNKGKAVAKLLDRLQIPKESAIAFGDGMNDKQLMQAVGEGFAMGNAHPDLFQYAKHRTTTVEDSGIYKGLQSLGLLN